MGNAQRVNGSSFQWVIGSWVICHARRSVPSFTENRALRPLRHFTNYYQYQMHCDSFDAAFFVRVNVLGVLMLSCVIVTLNARGTDRRHNTPPCTTARMHDGQPASWLRSVKSINKRRATSWRTCLSQEVSDDTDRRGQNHATDATTAA